jgi:hypothetical protein
LKPGAFQLWVRGVNVHRPAAGRFTAAHEVNRFSMYRLTSPHCVAAQVAFEKAKA